MTAPGRACCVLLLAGALLGCRDTTGPGTDPFGTFTVTVSGALTGTFSGHAVFGSDPNEGFLVLLITPGNTDAIVIVHEVEGRPASGTYEIGPFENTSEFGAVYAREHPALSGFFTSVTGDVAITSSTSARLEGTFSFTAIGHIDGDLLEEHEVDVIGSFSATCVAGDGVHCD